MVEGVVAVDRLGQDAAFEEHRSWLYTVSGSFDGRDQDPVLDGGAVGTCFLLTVDEELNRRQR